MQIKTFITIGGHHCITNAMRQIFEFNHYPISEAMLFGLGSSLNFIYLNLAHAPMIAGRNKTEEADKLIMQETGIIIQTKMPKDYAAADKILKDKLVKQIPVMIFVDMAYLKYLNLGEKNHFGGHAVVVFGYDKAEDIYYISDRDNHNFSIHTPNGRIAEDFHKITSQEMQNARNSAHHPFPAKNKWVKFDFSKAKSIDKNMISQSILINSQIMLQPPANLLGLNGIKKFSIEIKKWKTFPAKKLQLACINNYFMISADGGTGGGVFRKMYGDFLDESAIIANNKLLHEAAACFYAIADLWDNIAQGLMEVYNTGAFPTLDKLSDEIQNVAIQEEKAWLDLKKIIR